MSWMNEYPRPQLRRESFLSLNGPWLVNGQEINVPFAPQATLSGWQGPVPDELRYERRVTLPEGFQGPGERVWLHFGAVDQMAAVWVNGRPVAHHEGGYLPFSVDVTDALKSGENLITVDVTDTLDRTYPYGKQSRKPHGMWYTPVSGIWQTVWMEAVPVRRIEALKITPGLDSVTLTVICDEPECTVQIQDGEPLRIHTHQPATIPVANPHLWSPEDPYLYDFTVKTVDDCVQSYFALRTVEVKQGRILLNDKPIFLNGVLDQGYFADGLFLPSEPSGYEDDVRRMKALGFNLLRKHIKVEPEAFYYACDRLGMLVMQDMVNNGGYNFLLDTALPTIGLKKRSDRIPGQRKRKAFFRQHSLETVAHVYNHPCIVAYTIFNEGWGQFDADDMYTILRHADPTRIWDATSGWFHQHLSDVESLHVYFRNARLKASGDRPVLLSECGGYARAVEGHLFKLDAKYGYGEANTEETLTDKIALMYEEMVLPSIPEGLCGVVYTQVSDVEEEINGLYTYDRQVCKVNPHRMREILNSAVKALADSVK